MRFQRFLNVTMATLFAVTIIVGFQIRSAEARGFRGGFQRGKFHHGGFRHHGFRDHHRFHGGSFFLGLGLGLVGLPFAYSTYYPAYPSYGASVYAPYGATYGGCYAYDAYGRCVRYAPAGGYYYPY